MPTSPDKDAALPPPLGGGEQSSNSIEADSFLSEQRALREAMAKERTIDMPAPWSDQVAVRFRVLSPEVLRQIADRGQEALRDAKTSEARSRVDREGNCDILAAACVNVLAKRNGKWEGIDPDAPVRFDKRLARLFDFEADTARQVVVGFYNDLLQVNRVSNELVQWMTSARVDLDKALAGE